MRLAFGVLLLAATISCHLRQTVRAESAWQRHVIGTTDDLHLIAFGSREVGYAVAHASGRVFRTENEGSGWTSVTSLDSGYVEDIVASGRDSAWITAARGAPHVTGDGGRHWTRGSGIDSSAMVGALVRAPAGGLWAIGTRPGRGSVLRYASQDGAAWRLLDTLPTALRLASAAHATNDGALLVGGRGSIVRVDASGAAIVWQGAASEVVRGIASHGGRIMAVGHEGLVVSSDNGGRAWRRLQSFTSNRLRDVVIVDHARAFAVGDANRGPGTLFESRDGGAMWTPQGDTLPDLHRLLQSGNTLWAVGKRGTVISRTMR